MSWKTIEKRLNFLYGKEDADLALNELKEIVNAAPKVKKKGKRFSKEDVVLITYGDNIIEPGVKTLKSFKKFSKLIKKEINSVHFLPFFPYSSDYGFSVIDYMKINPKLGGWKDVRDIGKDFKLMFDFVLNHVSSKSIWFKGYLKGEERYKDYFIDVDPKTDLSDVFRPRLSPLLTKYGSKHIWTTFSADQVDPNYHNPKVLLDMIRYLMFFIKNRCSMVRLDAVAFMWKELGTTCMSLKQTHEIVKLLRDITEMVNPNVLLVTETNVPHKENISYFGKGDEAHMVYQFPLPGMVLHAFLKGNSTYLLNWLKSVGNLPKDRTFFNFLSSHDGIGVLPTKGLLPEKDREWMVAMAKKHNGKVSYKKTRKGKIPYELNLVYYDAINDPNSDESDDLQVKRFIAAEAVRLSVAGVPAIYIHSLLGSRNYYKGLKSGWNRDINHEKLNLKKVVKELEDKDSVRYKVFTRYMRLLRIRRGLNDFDPAAKQKVIDVDKRVFSIKRGSLVVLINVSDETVVLKKKFIGKDLIIGKKFNNKLEPYQIVWLK